MNHGVEAQSLIPSLASFQKARDDLEGITNPTPILTCRSLAERLSLDRLYLKPECLQRTGSFKFRGAYTKIHRVAPTLGGRGVVTYSSGNHGQAVALAAALHGVPAAIVMPEDAVQAKVDAARAYGAEVWLAGHTSLERLVVAEEIVKDRGWEMIPPFDDPDIISGQATVGLEIAREAPDTDAVLVPVGGGGLAAGIALALAEKLPHARVWGVEPEGADDARRSLEAGALVTLDRPSTLADGLRTSRVGAANFEILRSRAAGVVTVSEGAIMAAVRLLLLRAKLVVEPSGAVGMGALLEERIAGLRRPTLVLSGGNVSPETLSRCLAEGKP